jgi:two-component system chemotaxis response regulator CheB
MSDVEQTAGDRWPIIALIASAGGVDALSRVLKMLPSDLPAAVVVLLHLSPDQDSQLPLILSRVSALDVGTARDGERLVRGRVIVVPPGKHLLVTHDLRVVLIPSGPYPPSRPSGDLLLATLATAGRERVVAVVLSGTGHDAATGVTAVHRFGGTVLASDEASSQSFSMPSAAIRRDDAMDRVAHLDDLGTLLVQLVTAPRIGPKTLGVSELSRA